MFKNDNASLTFNTSESLYCVWIRANETPGAPLIAVWVDPQMRAFENVTEADTATAAAVEVEEETPEPVDG